MIILLHTYLCTGSAVLNRHTADLGSEERPGYPCIHHEENTVAGLDENVALVFYENTKSKPKMEKE